MKLLLLLVCLCADAFALKYDCIPPKYSTFDKMMSVELLTYSSIKIDGHPLSRDTTFRPRLEKQYLRFEGDTSFLTADRRPIDVLLDEAMFYGENKATMKIILNVEGYYNDYFTCTLH